MSEHIVWYAHAGVWVLLCVLLVVVVRPGKL